MIATITPLVTDPVMIFFIVLVIILLAPILLNRLKIPHIIGMIVAGVAIGPYGIGLLSRDASFEIFGQVGILYLMFLAGIEIDMYHLKKNMSKGLTFGLYTFIVPMVLGTLTSVWMLGYSWLTAILLASMYASHTLIAYPIVSRLGLNKSPAVIITIAGTIVTVLGALIVLAAIVGIWEDGEFSALGLLALLGRLVAYCLVIVYLFPRLTRWFFKRYSEPVTQFIYVLAMVFLASYSAKAIGLESVLGAFYAGLVLNRYIPNMSPLMNRIEFVGNAIFIPYFLIGVGMLINVNVVVSSWQTLYVAAVMSVVATLCKWLAAWLTQLTYRMSSLDRSMIFGLSNAQAAATLAAVMIGFRMGIFNEDVLNGTIVMILVTCAISSIITERAATRMRVAMLSDDTGAPDAATRRGPSNMLISVSNPVTASSLVDFAVLMYNPSRESRLYALNIITDDTPGHRAIGRTCLEQAQQAAAAMDLRIEPIERFDLNVTAGLVNTIKERDVSEVIIGMHRKATVIDSFFGSKIEQLIKSTSKMVLIARCFIPVNAVTRIVVVVPPKAEYETGFARWVNSLGRLTRQIGCRIIFCCNADTRRCVRGVLMRDRFEIRSEYRDVEGWDDFVLLANHILDDDLFVVVNARRSSVSFSSSMDELPMFLQKYFSRNNLVVIYPEQFGARENVPSAIDPLASDFTATPSSLWVRIASFYRRMIILRKRFTQRNRVKKIDL
ncbi:cation:proton antiporter [uncultured Muribaculum sp.]|uniref:cation:proton antiporter n=1 Tax=uncultured Muribaculum sp. TaxID=1918613 RepID=UPI0025DCDDFE|nr:cation:proton antiporter [uncultured Muribaculum sp.]